MAKKRRAKQGVRTSERRAASKPASLRSDADEPTGALKNSLHSSQGTLSDEAQPGDSLQANMTSVVGSGEGASLGQHDNEEASDIDIDNDFMGEHDDDYDEDDGDTVSVYPPSRYPPMSSSPRPEMPWSPAEGLTVSTTSDIAASTRSLWEQDLDYRELYGRRYCKDYYMPNDEMEQLRLALQHQVFLHVLDGELTSVTLDNPTHLLDVGTGTGEWAIRLAELFPRCEVVGTDIAAIAETSSVPMNVFFEIEDAEDWDRLPDYYDLIHFRSMEGAFQDWPFIYDNVYYSLKPGGWIEVQDFDTTEGLDRFRAHLPPESPLHALMADLEVAAVKAGRQRGAAHMSPRVLMESGFVDVRVTEYVVPISIAEKSAGKIWLISCLDSLEANCLRWLTEYMGWDPEECKAACETAAREMAHIAKHPEKSKGLIVKVRIVVARKPSESGVHAQVPPFMRETAGLGAITPPHMQEGSEGSSAPNAASAQEPLQA